MNENMPSSEGSFSDFQREFGQCVHDLGASLSGLDREDFLDVLTELDNEMGGISPKPSVDEVLKRAGELYHEIRNNRHSAE